MVLGKLGVCNIKPKYQFTNRNSLVEVADVLVSMGIDTYKFSLAPSTVQIPTDTNIKSLVDVVTKVSVYKQVLDMPELKNYICWCYSVNGPNLRDGFTSQDETNEFQQIYDLTAYLLITYSGTGKKFFLGNWETDWGALGLNEYDDPDPSSETIENIIRYMNVRQRAVDHAKTSLGSSVENVDVFHYVEVVMIKEAIEAPDGYNRRCINAVIPHIPDLDYVSWSAYTSEDDEERDVHALLDYIESKMPTNKSDVISGKRVFIGEYGWMHLDGLPCAQHHAAFLRSVFSWGCPFAVFWQMYGGGVNTFCLVRPDGFTNHAYDLYVRYCAATQHHPSPTNDEALAFFTQFLEDTDKGVLRRNSVYTMRSDNELSPLQPILLQDGTVLDLNGHNQRCNGVFNVGANGRIINSSSVVATLVIEGTCMFGTWANNWYSGYKNGKGNAKIEGLIDVVVRGSSVCVTFDAANAIYGNIIVDDGATLIAKAYRSLGDCTTFILRNGALCVNAGNVFHEASTIVIERNALQMICNVSDTYVNPIVIHGGKGVSGKGLIDTTGKKSITLSGNVSIFGCPKLGGHFGGDVTITGSILSPPSLPVTVRRGVCSITPSLHSTFECFALLNGCVKINGCGWMRQHGDMIVCSNGDCVIDMCGNNITLNTLCIACGKYKAMLTNSGKVSAKFEVISNSIVLWTTSGSYLCINDVIKSSI